MMKYEYYDKERDFAKHYIEKSSKHNIYPLSKEGLIKYLKQAKFLHETFINPNSVNNETNNNIIEDKNNMINKSKNNEKIILHDKNNSPQMENKKNIKSKHKKSYNLFVPKIISKSLRNKYLIKKLKNKSKSCSKIEFKELPIIMYNKCIGKRKVEINKFKAHLSSSSLSNIFTNHKSYYMGEKYNPENYNLDYPKNRINRNEYGILYEK